MTDRPELGLTLKLKKKVCQNRISGGGKPRPGLEPRLTWRPGQVPPQHRPHEREREYDEEADAGDRHHGPEGDGARGVVVDGHEVDEEGGAADQGGEQEGGGQHLADPHLGSAAQTKKLTHVFF